MSDDELAGRTVLVTGAASGIGAAAVARFVAAKARVVAADRAFARPVDDCRSIEFDVSDPAAVEEAVRTTRDAVGPIEILVNCAGIGSRTDVLDCSPQTWDEVFAVNVRGVFLTMKHALPAMLERGHGVIVNLGSVAGVMGAMNQAAYSASKGAVIALTRQAAVQYASRGIRCVCLCPGPVDTPWLQRTLDSTGDAEGARGRLSARIPLGRIATPAEIADAIAFISSPTAGFWTGATVMLDGGVSAGGAAPIAGPGDSG